ncbi:MAG: poly-beta-1,6-N-acetyl-D-glucosamine N-deacetylase PgaB [Candidatus Dadabacteria bacterium]
MILILLFLLVSGISHAQENNQPIRAAQVFHSDANNYAEFEREVIRMKHLGVNIMIFRVFGNKGDRIYKFANPNSDIGVYFKTTHSPVIDDVLGKVTKIAHKHGIKVFAWMTTRHAIYDAEEDVWDSEYSFSEMDYKTLPKLDLFNDQAVWRLQQLYADLAKYPIDGVLIQDDFVMRHMEGFGTEARVQYLSQYNKLLDAKNMYTELELKDNGRVKRIIYSDEFWQFQGWKNAQLILVADELIKILKEANPRLEVALNVSYELFHNPKNALAWFAHDKILAKKFNYVAVMAYQDQMMKELGVSLDEAGDLIKENTDKAIEAMGSPERVIMKIQTIDWDTSKELSLKQIRFTYQKVEFVSPDVGIALAPWENRNYNFMKD